MRTAETGAGHVSKVLAQRGTKRGLNVCPFVDRTNPLGMGPDGLGLMLGFNTSGAEQMAGWAKGDGGKGVQRHRPQRGSAGLPGDAGDVRR